jgi:hypothetical protein
MLEESCGYFFGMTHHYFGRPALPSARYLAVLPVLLMFLVASHACKSTEPRVNPRSDAIIVERIWEELPNGTNATEIMQFLDRSGVNYSYLEKGDYYGRQLITQSSIKAIFYNYKQDTFDQHLLEMVFYLDEEANLERIWTKERLR